MNLQLISQLIHRGEIKKAQETINQYNYSIEELQKVNFLKGMIFLKLEEYPKSLNYFKKSFKHEDFKEDSLNNICLILRLRNKKKILLNLINLLLKLKSKKDNTIFNISKLYDFLGIYDDSIKILDTIKNTDPEIIGFKASLYRKKKLIPQALKIIENHKNFKGNFFLLKEKASCLAYLEKFEDALKIINQLLKDFPKDSTLLFTKSTYLLNLNNYRLAMKFYDYRFGKTISKEKFSLKKKLWIGEPVGKLLVWSEDGLGDHIIFLKLIEFIKNVDRIYIIVDRRLHSLYQRYLNKKKIKKIFIIHKKIKLIDYNAHIPAGSLMKYVDVNKIDKVNYLEPLNDEEFNFNTKYINIGISWKTLNKNHAYRTLPFKKFINIFSKFPNVKLYNLQFGKIEEEIQLCKEKNIKLNLFKNLDYKEDIEKVSSLIKGLDLVVSSQNTVAHLASAIGKKVLLLLPIGHRWYWNFDNISKLDNWYQNATVLKQNTLYNWDDALEKLKNEIAKIKKD